MVFDWNQLKLKAFFVVGVVMVFAAIYRFGTDASDWNAMWRPNMVDNAFFSLGTTVTADTANISPVSAKAKLLVMLQMIMVIVVLVWDL